MEALYLSVTMTEHAESIIIATEPDVESVLFDPLAARRTAAARFLAAEPPAQLVDGDVVLVSPIRGHGGLARRRQGSDSPAEDRDALSRALGQAVDRSPLRARNVVSNGP